MKKILLFATAAIMLAGCAKHEILDGSESYSNQIRISPDAGKQTKGSVTTTTELKDFHAHGYTYSGLIGSNTTLTHASHTDVTLGGGVWTSTKPLFWTEGLQHAFYAISPAPMDGPYNVANPGTAIDNTTHEESNDLVSYTYTLPVDPAEHIDILGGRAVDIPQTTEIVNIPLNHISTRLNISAKLSDLSPNSKILITEVKVLGSEVEGTIAANPASKFYSAGTFQTLKDDNYGTWLGTPSTSAMALSTILDTKPQSIGTTPYETASIDIALTTATTLFKGGEYLFLIPTNNKEGITSPDDIRILLKYDIVNAVTGAATSTEAVVSLPEGSMKMGLAYNATFIIGVDTEVQFVTSVEEWNEPTPDDNTDLDAPSVIVADAAEATIIKAVQDIDALSLLNSNISYYNIYVNAPMPADGALDLSTATTLNMKVADKIFLNFKAPVSPTTRAASTLKITPPKFWSVAPSGENGFIMIKQTTKVYPAANCYIINRELVKENDFVIPFQHLVSYNAQLSPIGHENKDFATLHPKLLSDIKASGAVHMRVNWTDFANSADFDMTFTPDLTDVGIKVTFGPNTDKLITEGGNVSVSLLRAKDGEVAHTWHLWFTDYNPGKDVASTTGGDIHKYDGYTFTSGYLRNKFIMDRNLGAKITGIATGGDIAPATEVESERTHGLFYQHGRKEPFTKVIGDGTNGFEVPTSTILNRVYLVDQHPTQYYYNNEHRWMIIGKGHEAYLWSRSKPTNPCPYGWTVPADCSPWYGWGDGTNAPDYNTGSGGELFKWNDTSKGRAYKMKDGSTAWYPLSGYRSTDGYNNNVGTTATAELKDYIPTALYYNGSSTIPQATLSGISDGTPVRCVQL